MSDESPAYGLWSLVSDQFAYFYYFSPFKSHEVKRNGIGDPSARFPPLS